jgi:hypothetical protein
MRLQFGVELKRQGGRKASNLDVPILASLYAKRLRKSGRKHEMAEGCYRLASEAKTETARLSQERRSRLIPTSRRFPPPWLIDEHSELKQFN